MPFNYTAQTLHAVPSNRLEAGTRCGILFDHMRPGLTSVHVLEGARKGAKLTIRTKMLYSLFGLPFTPEPQLDELEEMVGHSVITTVTGHNVEPDGWADDGSPSWFLILGLI